MKTIKNIISKIKSKHFFIAILSVLVFCTSFLMVTEAKEFYDIFFGKDSWKSWMQAILLESMVVVLANVKLEDKFMNICCKGLVMCAFIGLVFSAGMQSVLPAMKILENDKIINTNNDIILLAQANKQKQTAALVKLTQNYMESSKKSAEHFRKIGWVKNAAMKSQNEDKIFKNITKTLSATIETKVETTKETESVSFLGVNMSIINIVIMLCLRVFLQLAALICSKCIGILYRTEEKVVDLELKEKDDVSVVVSENLQDGILTDDITKKDVSTLKKLVSQLKRSNKVVARSNAHLANAVNNKTETEEKVAA